MTLAVERSTSIPFWQAFDAKGVAGTKEYEAVERRVFAVQRGLREDLRKLADELWPQ